MRFLTLVLAAVALFLGAAGVALAQTTPAPSGASAPALCPSGVSLTVSPPTASAPSTVNVAVTPPVNLQPASASDPASFHLHYFIDLDPATVLQPGQPIPTANAKIIHTAATTQDLGTLASGQHTVWVVLANVSHVPCSPNVEGEAAFTAGGAGSGLAGGSTAAKPAGDNGCFLFDSWCNYCNTHPKSDACKQYPA